MVCLCVPTIVVNGARIVQLSDELIEALRQHVSDRIDKGETSFVHAGRIEIECPEHPNPRQVLELEIETE